MNQKLIGFTIRKAGVFFLFFMMLATWSQASSPDSLRTRWINGKKYVLHKVAPKETFSSVSRKYNVSIAELQQANPGVAGLKIGQIINVPVVSDGAAPEPEPQSTPKPAPTPKPASSAGSAKTHTVVKGETLYRISKMYGMTVDDLKALNGLSSNNVSLGQKLKVNPGTAVSSPIVTVPTPVKEPVAAPEPVKEPVTEPVKTPVNVVPTPVVVTLTAEPASARFEVDGEMLDGNPVTLTREKGSIVSVVTTAQGFEPRPMKLAFTEAREQRVTLTRLVAAVAPTTQEPRHQKTGTRPPPPPGGKKGGKLTVDETNPYE